MSVSLCSLSFDFDILAHLNPSDLRQLACVNRKMNHLVKRALKHKVLRDFAYENYPIDLKPRKMHVYTFRKLQSNDEVVFLVQKFADNVLLYQRACFRCHFGFLGGHRQTLTIEIKVETAQEKAKMKSRHDLASFNYIDCYSAQNLIGLGTLVENPPRCRISSVALKKRGIKFREQSFQTQENIPIERVSYTFQYFQTFVEGNVTYYNSKSLNLGKRLSDVQIRVESIVRVKINDLVNQLERA